MALYEYEYLEERAVNYIVNKQGRYYDRRTGRFAKKSVAQGSNKRVMQNNVIRRNAIRKGTTFKKEAKIYHKYLKRTRKAQAKINKAETKQERKEIWNSDLKLKLEAMGYVFDEKGKRIG